MCGRFALHSSPHHWGQLYFSDWSSTPEEVPHVARFNIAPSQRVNVCFSRGVPSVATMRWGFNPGWRQGGKSQTLLINARSETIEQKEIFSDAFRFRRCLIPADGFFEWRQIGRKKYPYYMSSRSGGAFAMAGIWTDFSPRNDNQRNDQCFCVLTTRSNRTLSELHQRMPVILSPEDYSTWMDPRFEDYDHLRSLLQPADDSFLQRWSVSSIVNRVHSDSIACIRKVPEPSVSIKSQMRLF